MSSRTEKKMAKKMPALQGPLRSWVTTHSWRFETWNVYHTLGHPWGLAVRLSERGEKAQEAQRLLRTIKPVKVGLWYVFRTEDIARLRPVWVAGFRRTPTRFEVDNECILEADELEGHLDG